MDQVRHTRTLSNGPTPTPTATTTINSNNDDNSSHNIILIESGLEDTVSSSGFVSGSGNFFLKNYLITSSLYSW